MNKRLQISQILVYYDFPEVFLALDQVDTNYLCLCVEFDDDHFKYISCAISSNKLVQYLNGKIDLRTIFLNPELKEWYYFDYTDEDILAQIWPEENLPEAYLPDPGFIYEKPTVDEDLILQEVVEKNNAIVHLAISDSQGTYSIAAGILGDIMKVYQNIIESVYKKVIAKLKKAERNSLLTSKNYDLRAFNSSPGSFNIHMCSESDLDVFGKAYIEYGLEKFDEIIRGCNNQESYIELLRPIQGRAVSNLKILAKQLINNNIEIKHKWSSPSSNQVHSTVMNRAKADKIIELLDLSNELEVEIKNFTGYFEQVDVDKGTWRVFNQEDEKEYKGEAERKLLNGVTVKTEIYKIKCSEKIEEHQATGKEQINYTILEVNKNI